MCEKKARMLVQKAGRTIKKSLALMLAFLLLVSFGGCSALPSENTEPAEEPAAEQPAENPADTSAEAQNPSDSTEDQSSENPDASQSSDEVAEPAIPSVYTLALDGGCSSLDYYKALSPSAKEIMTNCIISLTEPDSYGNAVQAAADRLTVSDDRMVWTFHIRGGLYWVDNNGIPTEYVLTAQDYLDAVRLVADPAYGIECEDYLFELIKGLAQYREALETIDAGGESTFTREEVEASFESSVGVKLVDEYTIQYTLTEGTPHFNSLVQSSSLFLPVELDYYLEQGENFGSDMDHILYSGPYVVSHFERDKRITLTANSSYYAPDEVTIKTIEYVAVDQGTTQAQMFMDGKLSYADVTVDDYISMQHSEWENCLLPAGTSLSTDCMFLNFSSKNPEFAVFIQNADFRKALQLSIDRLSLAYLKDPINPSSVLRGTITAEECIQDSNGNEYTDCAALKIYKDANQYKPDEAKKAMTTAVSSLCSSDGTIIGAWAGKIDLRPVGTFKVDGKLPVQLIYVCPDDNDSIILAHLFESVIEESIGTSLIDVQIVCMADWTKSSVIDGNNFDMIMQSITTEYADPSAILAQLVAGGDLNYGNFYSDAYEMLVGSSMGVTDFTVRLDIFSRAEALILQENYILPLTSSDNAYCMTFSKPFTGPLTIFGSRRFKGLELTAQPVTNEEYQTLLEEYQNSRH